MWDRLASRAALLAFASWAVAKSTPTVQDLDEPYLADDTLYFPRIGAVVWVNPNATAAAATAGQTRCSVVAPFPMADCYGLPLEEATVDQMQDWMASGVLTSRQLTRCYLGRILQLNEYVKYVKCRVMRCCGWC